MTPSEVRRKQVQDFAATNHIPVRDHSLLSTALTHTSYANEHRQQGIHDNERLEFLGDAVLDLVIGEYLFRKYPAWPEGDLTRAKASAVCEPALASCARKFHLGETLRLGKGEEHTGGRQRASILADAFEAVVGAIYLDTSYETATEFIMEHLKPYLDLIDRGDYTRDYKTELQEFLQQDGDVDLRYNLLRDEGPDHDKTFYMEVELNGEAVASGVGKSKKAAAQQAAQAALQKLETNGGARS